MVKGFYNERGKLVKHASSTPSLCLRVQFRLSENQKMEHLWSPWRMKYMQQDNSKTTCIFCDALQANRDDENLIVHRGKNAFVILNRYPYTSGHVMVVPFVHKPFFEDLDTGTQLELMTLLTTSTHVLRQVYHPDGFNMGANIGNGSGAGVIGHIHFHLVPRWSGDSNFMTTVSDARVIPEDLPQTLQRLREAWLK
jgi:ATP adenylyltransferase